jgi:acetyltransferase
MTMPTIMRATAEQAHAVLGELVQLLQDVVNSGASVGFLPPLSDELARDYWAETVEDVSRGRRILLLALQHGVVVGAVQLALAGQQNGQHRAEVQKLMVHTQARRQGTGQALMTAIEAAAQTAGRTLLVLDTRHGDTAEQLYLKQGYVLAGIIPQYAKSANGDLHATAIFYRFI